MNSYADIANKYTLEITEIIKNGNMSDYQALVAIVSSNLVINANLATLLDKIDELNLSVRKIEEAVRMRPPGSF